eukprot:5961614-Lingulodinium_polyedra.AAC.1
MPTPPRIRTLRVGARVSGWQGGGGSPNARALPRRGAKKSNLRKGNFWDGKQTKRSCVATMGCQEK